ncbi:MAG: shikimate kinase [Cyanobacteria bacterium J06632_22]
MKQFSQISPVSSAAMTVVAQPENFLKGTNVYLIGMMGSGKSTTGQQLAQQLGYRFLDTDALIVQATGQSINQIFEAQGEAAFREIETQVLAQVSPHTRLVVATGGGIVTQQMNWSYLQHGVVAWLDVPVDQLVARLKGDDTRPLLQAADLSEKLNKLLDQRRTLYAQADVRIPVGNGDGVDAIAQRTIAALQQIIKTPEQPIPAEPSPTTLETDCN